MIRLFLIVCADRLAVVFFAVLLALVFTPAAHAYQPQLKWHHFSTGAIVDTPAAACQGGSGYPFHHVTVISSTKAECYHDVEGTIQLFGEINATFICPLIGEVSANTQTCPDNCPSGEFLNANGVCVRDCTGKQGQATANGNYSFTGAVSEWAVNGCQVNCPQRVLTGYGGGGYGCVFTGAPVENPTDPTLLERKTNPEEVVPEKPDDCLNQGHGYVQSSSGSVSCIKSSEAPEGQKPDKTTQTATKSTTTTGTNGEQVKTTATTETTRSGGTSGGGGSVKQTTTTTTDGTTDNNGNKTCPSGYTLSGGVCSKVEIKESDSRSFCDENPKSFVCTGEGGDDMCSKAENKNLAACTDLGNPEDTQGDLATKPFQLTAIPTVAFAASNTCPSSINLPHGAVFTFEPICDAMGWLRPIVLAMAWLSAGLIVVGALRI